MNKSREHLFHIDGLNLPIVSALEKNSSVIGSHTADKFFKMSKFSIKFFFNFI